MSEVTFNNVREFRIPRVIGGESTTTTDVVEQTAASVERVSLTPDMEMGVSEYVTNYQTPYTDRQRAIAVSVLKHSFFLPAGRHSRPRR